jgi:hypothetical protein
MYRNKRLWLKDAFSPTGLLQGEATTYKLMSIRTTPQPPSKQNSSRISQSIGYAPGLDPETPMPRVRWFTLLRGSPRVQLYSIEENQCPGPMAFCDVKDNTIKQERGGESMDEVLSAG